jgi:Na+-driven multidrug efflux pump
LGAFFRRYNRLKLDFARPAGDALDRQISKLTLPAVLNLLIIPMVGIVDMMWVGRMNDALAIAGMQVKQLLRRCYACDFVVMSIC